MKFNNNDQEKLEAKEFIQRALRQHFKGDSQQIFDHLPAFMETDAVKGLLERYEKLQAEVYASWEAQSYGNSQSDIVIQTVSDADGENIGNSDNPQEVTISNSEMPTEINLEGLSSQEDETNEDETDSGNEIKIVRINDGEASESDEITDSEEGEQVENDDEMETPPPSGPPIIPGKLIFTNGKTGVEYVEKIDLSDLNRSFESITNIEATGFEEAGLTFDSESLRITGIPENAGKFILTVLVEYDATTERPAQTYRLQGSLDIMPDPRNLWRELEPDENLPYPKPHSSNDSIAMNGRYMIAASRRGRSHAHSGTYRDDDFALAVKENDGWYIIAVADGAGSAPFSRKGSQIACDKSVEELQAKLTYEFGKELEAMAESFNGDPTDQMRQQIRSRIYEPLSHAAYAGYKAITAEAEKIGQAVKTFHTTLMISIVKQFDFGYFVGTWWVGDGGVGVYQRGKRIKVMGKPDCGEFAGQTRFLTMPEIWADGATVLKRIEFDIVDDFTAIMLMSDGITDPKIGTDYNLGQVSKWDELWDDLNETVDFAPENIDAEKQLLEWLDFWSPGEHDDRTIAILY